MIKKYVKKISICIFAILVSGCAVLQDDEISSLKIKVLNLETLQRRQESRLDELERKVDRLEAQLRKELGEKFIQAQSKMIAEIEETKREIALLSGKIEELHLQREAEGRALRKGFEEMNLRLDTLDVKIRSLEKEMGNLTARLKELSRTEINGTQQTPGPSQLLQNGTTQNGTTPSPIASKPAQIQEPPLKEEDYYKRAFQLYERGDLKGAKALFEEYLKKFPKGKWVGQTYFYLGEIAFKEKDYETAILEYQKLIDMPGANPLKPRAMLRQADAFLALKDRKAAEILYRRIINIYPGTREAKEAEAKLKALR